MNNKEKIDGVTPPKDLDECLTKFMATESVIGKMYNYKSTRMEIAIEAMKALLAKDFKNIGFSAFNNSKQNPAQYIADQAFILADAMIERENKKEVESDE